MEINKPVIKQLIVNQISLPYDILYIIKEYAFEDSVSENSKYCKNIVNSAIKHAICASIEPFFGNLWYDQGNDPDPWGDDDILHELYGYEENRGYLIFAFWGGGDDDLQFQSHFCFDCGNYVNRLEYFRDNIKCKCINN